MQFKASDTLADAKGPVIAGVMHDADRKAALIPDYPAEFKALAERICDAQNFTGKEGKQAVAYPMAEGLPECVILMGLGKREDYNLHAVRCGLGKAAGAALSQEHTACTVLLPAEAHRGPAARGSGRMVADVMVLKDYRFLELKTEGLDEITRLEEVVVVAPGCTDLDEITAGATEGAAVAEAANWARGLANLPGNVLTPAELARRAEEMAAAYGLECRVQGPGWMREQGMGAFLGVAAGSAQEPRFIEIHYRGKPGDEKCFLFVGKAITFDSGGISIKPSAKMEDMKFDMCGGAAALGAIRAAAALKLPVNVTALVGATENLPGGSAQRPGDIVKAANGLTIEVINTDAEGRLVLADLLSYGQRYAAHSAIDLATLTGACVVALGNEACGMMGTAEEVMEKLSQAGEAVHERCWKLPLYKEYEEQIKSDYADVKNVGSRWGGAITAAAFIKKFAGDLPWVHLDIAGMDVLEKSGSSLTYLGAGASGFGVRLLAEYLRLELAEGK